MKFFAPVGILAIVLLAGWISLPFLPAFVWALIIHQVGQPLQCRLLRRFTAGRTAILMLLFVTLTIVVPMTLVGGQLVIEATNAFEQISSSEFILSSDSAHRIVAQLPLSESLRNRLESYNLEEALVSHAADISRKLLTIASTLLGGAAKSAGGFLFSVVAFLFLYYCTCVDGPSWYRRIVRAVPAEFGVESLLTRLSDGATALFWGVAGTCLAQGVAGGLLFMVLGLPSPILIGALIALCALVPVIGTAIIWAPFALWLAVTGSGGKALILTLCGIFVIGSMDNLTRPILTRLGGAEISVLTVTLGAIGGLALFGLTGLVVGPLAIESFSWLLDRLAAEQGGATAVADASLPPDP